MRSRYLLSCPPRRRDRLSNFIATVGAVTALSACSHAADANRVTEQASLGPDGRDAGSGPVVDSDAAAKGPRIVSARANGTGCAKDDSWDAVIAPDGASVLFTLRAYGVTVAQGQSSSIQDCTFTVTVADAAGYAFTLDRFDGTGVAALQGDGVHAEESLKAWFQGNPLAAETRTNPYTAGSPAGSYAFDAAFGGDTAVWSPCGAARDLDVTSRLVLQNNADRTGSGSIKPGTAKLELALRRCGA